LSATLSGCSAATTQDTPSPSSEAAKVEPESTVDGQQNESAGKPLTRRQVVAIALLSPLALAGLALQAFLVVCAIPGSLLVKAIEGSDEKRNKEISRERSERLTALRQNVETRTVLCPGRTTDQALSDLWKAAEALGLHPEPARFQGKPAFEVTSAPSVWLRAYAEASGQVGSPVLVTVEVGGLSPEERGKYMEDFFSAFPKQTGIPKEELRETGARSSKDAEPPSPWRAPPPRVGERRVSESARLGFAGKN
jgi:hypothetical protein